MMVSLSRARAVACAAMLAIAVMSTGCGGGRLFGRAYEYEEDLYVSLDGTAELIVNASIPALVALRGLSFDTDPRSSFDRNTVRAAFGSDVAEVTHVSRPWRRNGRRFVQIQLAVKDIRRLSEAPPFAWSTYGLQQKDGLYVFTQTVGASTFKPGTLQNVGWDGTELVAFRLHLPSRIHWHNSRDLQTSETSDVERGNILRWEQALTDRLDGQPVAIEVRMDTQSILYRTLWLFAGAFVAAVLMLGGLIWWAMGKGAKEETAAVP